MRIRRAIKAKYSKLNNQPGTAVINENSGDLLVMELWEIGADSVLDIWGVNTYTK